MTREEMQHAMRKILKSHDAALASIRGANRKRHSLSRMVHVANEEMRAANDVHDAAIGQAIEANRAALRLLERMMNEGISE